MKDNKTVAVVPGSFDPITYGHIDIVRRAALEYDKVYLAVMINDQKQYMLTLEQREAIARAALSELENVEVISSGGMLWQLTLDLCADAIVKGFRNNTDYEYEMKMAEFNKEHNPLAKTVLLPADASLTDVSSTEVRRRISAGSPIDDMLPPSAAQMLSEILRGQNK